MSETTYTVPPEMATFTQYLYEHPNHRRVSQSDAYNIVQWLSDPLKRPSSQKDFSRRNYVRRAFTFDTELQKLLAISKTADEPNREVVEEGHILQVVKAIHEGNGHAGWDATWRDVSRSYYGILRADVIFILKRCKKCATDPRKRPKGGNISIAGEIAIESSYEAPSIDDIFSQNQVLNGTLDSAVDNFLELDFTLTSRV